MFDETDSRSKTYNYITVVQAYLNNKLELDLSELLSLHHLIDAEVRNFNYDSDLEKNLKIFKLAIKRRIYYLEEKSGTNTKKLKRRNPPILDINDLLEKIAA